jgi:hypothetical protein
MRRSSLVCRLVFSATLFTLTHSTAAYAQADDSEHDYRPRDTVFNEIFLSDEGVKAIDTLGNEWHYNFDKRTFVMGGPPVGDLNRTPERPENLRVEEIPLEDRCTERKEVRPFEQSVWVGYDEYVDDDIIAYGRVTIKGWAKGDVKSIRKRVLVTESGRVDGDIEAPEIVVRPGGLVLGKKFETGSPLDLKDITKSFSVDGVIVVLSFTVFLLFCGFLAVTLMPRQLASFGRCLTRYKVRSYLLGLLFVFLLPAILVLVIVTVIGLMVVPFVPLIYLVAFVLGIVAFSEMIGRHFSVRYLGGEKSALVQSTLGILLLMSFWLIVALFLGSNDDISQGFGIFFLVVSILLSSFPVLGGVGAAMLTRFGFREYVGWKERRGYAGDVTPPTPAPPPIPDDSSLGVPLSPSGPSDATPSPSSRIPNRED